MNLHEGLYAHLIAIAPLAALIGDRVYPAVIPQKQPADPARHPCIVYNRIGVDRSQTFCGTDPLVLSRVQLDCYAPDYDLSLAIAKSLRDGFMDFRGRLGGPEGVLVKMTALDSELELDDPDPGLYRVSQTYSVWHLDD